MLDNRKISDDLNLMQTVYAIALVLALRNIIETVYSVILSLDHYNFISSIKIISSIFLILLSMRFFWALGNIRRYLKRNETRLSKIRRYVISIHFFILLMHAFIIYFLSKYISDLTPNSQVDVSIIYIIHAYCFILIMNITWLVLLTLKKEDKFPEEIWIKNNCITLLTSLALFWLSVIFFDLYTLSFLLSALCFIINSMIDLFYTSSSYIADSD